MNERVKEIEARIEELGGVASSSLVDLQNELAWELRYADTARSLSIASDTLEAARLLDYDRGRARALLALGMGNVVLAKMALGLELLEEARSLLEAIGDLSWLATAVTALGLAEEHLGNLGRAKNWYILGLHIREGIGDEAGLPFSFNNLGAICVRLGDLPSALEHFYSALPYAEATGGMVLGVLNINIADIYNRSGEPDLALEHSLRALDVLRACGSRGLEGQALVGAGCIYRARGDLEQAGRFFDEALDAVRATGSRDLEAEALGEIGQLRRELGDFEGALLASSESLAIACDVEVPFVEVESLINIGETHEALGDTALAVEMLDRALRLARARSFGMLAYCAHGALARIHEREGRLREALDHYKAFMVGREQVLGEESTRKLKALLVKQQVELSRRETEALRIKNEQLDRALSEVKQLQGMLPICSYCKSIRDDGNFWQRIESYLSDRTDAVFSHGICPTCYDEHVQPKLDERERVGTRRDA